MSKAIQSNIALGADWNKAADRGGWSYKPTLFTDQRVVSYSGVAINFNDDPALKDFVVAKIQGRRPISETAGNRTLAKELPRSLKGIAPLVSKALNELGVTAP